MISLPTYYYDHKSVDVTLYGTLNDLKSKGDLKSLKAFQHFAKIQNTRYKHLSKKNAICKEDSATLGHEIVADLKNEIIFFRVRFVVAGSFYIAEMIYDLMSSDDPEKMNKHCMVDYRFNDQEAYKEKMKELKGKVPIEFALPFTKLRKRLYEPDQTHEKNKKQKV